MRVHRNRNFERFKDLFRVQGTDIFVKGTFDVTANLNNYNVQPARILEVNNEAVDITGKTLLEVSNGIFVLSAYYQSLERTTLYKIYQVTDILDVQRNVQGLNPVTKMVENKRLKSIGAAFCNITNNLKTTDQAQLSRRTSLILTNFELMVGDILSDKYKVSAVFKNAGLYNVEVEYGN